MSSARGSRWAVILAGGQGTRMQSAIARWLGEDRPKQFCTFIGTRSMLEHTMDRAASFCHPENTLTVISRGQQPYVDELLSNRDKAGAGFVVEQPIARGTAPGIHGGLSYILEEDPDATVIVLPSDHFIYPESAFLRCVEAAFEAAERWENRLILLAARPTGPQTDYGWIETGLMRESASVSDPGPILSDVLGFHEKPDSPAARNLYLRQGLWNTMVMVGKARTFSVLAWRTVPEMMWQFESLRQVLRAVRDGSVSREREDVALAQVYSAMTPVDFSRDILQRSVPDTLVLPMDGVYWSDWGRPERLQETLEQLDWSRSVVLPILAVAQ